MRFTPVILFALVAGLAVSCAGRKPAPDPEKPGEPSGLVGLENVRFLTGSQPFRQVPSSGAYDFVTPMELPDDPRFDAEATEQRIRLSVTRDLAKKGYSHGGVDPVFLVKVRLVLDENVDAFAPIRTGGQEAQWIRSVPGDASFEKGALILDLLDPKDEWSLWRGVCGAQAMTDVSEEQKEQRIDAIVQRLLKDFPPKK